ncbi:MAG: hypothetical protein M3O70_23725, partial [Actinomycetota bacterium]|nr:hypothetical protein [Actinomycetota bacterium]
SRAFPGLAHVLNPPQADAEVWYQRSGKVQARQGPGGTAAPRGFGGAAGTPEPAGYHMVAGPLEPARERAFPRGWHRRSHPWLAGSRAISGQLRGPYDEHSDDLS